LHSGRDRREHAANIGSEADHHPNYRQRDERCHDDVLNRGRGGFIREEDVQLVAHVSRPEQ